jgi:hypothetical protein
VGAEKAIGTEGETAADTVAWAIAPEPGHWTAKLVWHEPQVMRNRTGASPGEEKRNRVPQWGHVVVAVEGGLVVVMAERSRSDRRGASRSGDL